MENQVLESTKVLIKNPRYVFIDDEKITEVAKRLSTEEFEIPKWDLPVYPEKLNKDTIDFILLENTINFAFTDFETKQKFSTEYQGIEWRGATGMVACLKRAIYDWNFPILEGEYLKHLSRQKMQEIFKGNFEIPMLDERLEIFREVGEVLWLQYGNHFHNVVKESNHRLFNNGDGLIERLVLDFPSFDDSVVYGGKVIRFDKRAQLAPAILYGKFRNQGEFHIEDADELTVFADYVLPQGLRDFGILKYEDSLAQRIDSQQIIKKETREELEIRASTIHAVDRLIREVNKLREEKINILHMDYKLWSESRKNPKRSNHHLTPTIAY